MKRTSKFNPHQRTKPTVTQGKIKRTLLNGAVVNVVEAPEHKKFTMTKCALIGAKKSDPCQCAGARQAAQETGHYWEFYRNVAYEQVNKSTVHRYRVTDKVRQLEFINDLGLSSVQKLVGFEISLRAPSHATSLAAFRHRRKYGPKYTSRTVPYARSAAKMLGLRMTANHY